MFEFLNKIELKGIVGNVVLNNVGDSTVARFSVCTEYAYKSKDGSSVVDVTWHNCTAWKSDKNKISDLKRGVPVSLSGRIRNFRFMDANGNERAGSEIIVHDVEVLPLD